MAIDGDKNRIAGRDYYEYSGKIELTILPCSRCEERIIRPGKELCNHCQEELDIEAAKANLTLFAFAVLTLWGGAMHLFDLRLKEIGIQAFFILGLVSCFTVFILLFAWRVISEIWQMNR